MDFPTNEHAARFAEAGHCAHEQERFWDYYYILFENQDKVYDEDLIQHDIDLNLDVEQFTLCL